MGLLPPLVAVSWLLLVGQTACQSNYQNQANNVEYQGEGLPEEATLDGKVTKLDDLSPVIFLNRTKAALNCAAGSMQVELKFNDKFYGIAYADFDRNTACQIAGKGDHSYKLELPLKGCGTKQEPQRVFTNNIVVRFHPTLEMDGDEIITIVCRYPPPVAPIPAGLPDLFQEVPPAESREPPLNGFQILLIICAILFLSLLLLGLGCSYYCLRRRNMTVVHRAPFSSIGSDSEITKLSGSSLGNISMFEGLKIPRAHAPVTATGSSSGSEGPLISDTLPSDYPSESHSEIEDVDTRSLPVSSAGSFENKGYVHDSSSFYSESYGHIKEEVMQNTITTQVPRLPLPIKEAPKFDVQVRVKKAPPPSPPSLTSDTESSIARTERNLSTILEQREESIRSLDSPYAERTQFTYVPEIHPPPRHVQPAPTFTRILRRQQEIHEEMDSSRVIQPARSLTSLNTEMTDTHSVTEVTDLTHRKFVAPTPPPPPPIVPKRRYEGELEPPIVAHTTITEEETTEDIERRRHMVTEYHARPKPIPPKWDVTIKRYPVEMPEPPEWENFSDVSSASGLTLTPKMERATMSLPPQPQIDDNKLPLNSPELVGSIGQTSIHQEITRETYLKTFRVPLENPSVPNWNVLIRVLEPTEEEEAGPEEAPELTMHDRMKWRQIITTESTLRTMLTEAVVRDDYERIRHDQRYERLFEPYKWDVIIRILSPERPKGQPRYRKKSDFDTRSRRSSLPTLYEYDSDGGSSIRTLTNEPVLHPSIPIRIRRASTKSSYKSEADLRSMSEVTVDFARPDHGDSHSESSSYYPRYYDDPDYKLSSSGHHSLARSLSQPSLARSASEFTERWVAPSRYDTASEFTSPEGSPKSQRSGRIKPHQLPRHGRDSSMWQQSSSSSHVTPTSSGGQVLTREHRSEMMSSAYSRRDWFGDNDSESSYK